MADITAVDNRLRTMYVMETERNVWTRHVVGTRPVFQSFKLNSQYNSSMQLSRHIHKSNLKPVVINRLIPVVLVSIKELRLGSLSMLVQGLCLLTPVLCH